MKTTMIEYENLGKLNAVFFDDYKKSFAKTLDSGWYILGENVSNFEREYAAFCETNYCVGLASGLDALHLAINSFNFPAGSEIIVPSNTYIATILAIVNNNFIPVLVEPDIHTYNIDPKEIEKKINPKTKAIIVVHLYGKCCAMDEIMEIANRNDLKVIEDCAQSQGASFKGVKSGAFGHIGAHSFYPTKNLGALGDAGAITTKDTEIYEKIKTLRNYGSKVKYNNELLGFNSRLDEIQAGFLSIKLKMLNEINDHKRKLANLYLANIKSDFVLPSVNDDYFDVYHIFSIRHPKRNELREFLLSNEIKTEIHYPIPPNKQKAMQGVIHGEFPISEEIHNTTLSLPISFFHSEEEILRVIDVLNKF